MELKYVLYFFYKLSVFMYNVCVLSKSINKSMAKKVDKANKSNQTNRTVR